MTIDNDVEKWITRAIDQCERATAKGVMIIFRNDDDEIVITNALAAGTISALGQALSAEYGSPNE